MTDTIDRPATLDLDDEAFERPVVTHRPPRPPAPPGPPVSATLRYPSGPVPDVQDAPPVAARPSDPWVWPWQGRLLWGAWGHGGARRPWEHLSTWGREALRTREPSTRSEPPVRTQARASSGVAWPWTWQRSRVAAGLLGVFLGAFGLHRMYLGYWRRGLTMLAVTVVGGFFTLGLAAVLMGVWGFAEGLLYLSVRRGRFARDARGRPLRG
ncbi:TM2 domain-containing protein [Cellulomonas sp. URHB0016]